MATNLVAKAQKANILHEQIHKLFIFIFITEIHLYKKSFGEKSFIGFTIFIFGKLFYNITHIKIIKYYKNFIIL